MDCEDDAVADEGNRRHQGQQAQRQRQSSPHLDNGFCLFNRRIENSNGVQIVMVESLGLQSGLIGRGHQKRIGDTLSGSTVDGIRLKVLRRSRFGLGFGWIDSKGAVSRVEGWCSLFLDGGGLASQGAEGGRFSSERNAENPRERITTTSQSLKEAGKAVRPGAPLFQKHGGLVMYCTGPSATEGETVWGVIRHERMS